MINLVALTFAGGMQNVFCSYKEEIERKGLVQVLPFEYSGRGSRIHEPLYKNMQDAIKDISSYVRGVAEKGKIALWGHSLGAVLAYEVYCDLMSKSICPEFIVFSGANAPDAGFDDCINFDDVSAQEMMRQMAAVNGNVDAVSRYGTEIMEYFLPIIRSDLKLLDMYDFSKNAIKLNCPLCITYSSDDELISREGIERWKYFAKSVEFYKFSGDHFFIKDKGNVPEMARIINDTVERRVG